MLRFCFLLLVLSGVRCTVHSLPGKQPSSAKQRPTLSNKTVGNQEIVIEGTVISSWRQYFQGSIFTACVVEVNTLFKGELPEQVIEVFVMGGTIGNLSTSVSDGISQLPGVQTTAIFRLKAMPDDSPQKPLQYLTPYKLFTPATDVQPLFPSTYFRFENGNIEKELYHKLEIEAGRKRQLIRAPATFNPVAIAYSMEKNMLLPNRKKGLVFDLASSYRAQSAEQLSLMVLMTSANSIVFLQQGALEITYNPEALGDSVVSKGRLTYEVPRNYNHGNATRSNAIPEYFAASVADSGPNKFVITWTNTAPPDSCYGLRPSAEEKIAAELYFKPLNKEKPLNLQLKGLDTLCLQYDYVTHNMIPFDYVATPKIRPMQAAGFMHPEITAIAPDRMLQTGDTVTITGKNFGMHAVISVYAKASSGHFRYRDVPNSCVLSRSDSTMVFVIPPLALPEKGNDLSQEWFPVTGKIRVSKGYDNFQVSGISAQDLLLAKTP